MVNCDRQLNDQKDSWVFEISHQTRPERQSHASTNVCRAHFLKLSYAQHNIHANFGDWHVIMAYLLLSFSRAIPVDGAPLTLFATTFF